MGIIEQSFYSIALKCNVFRVVLEILKAFLEREINRQR